MPVVRPNAAAVPLNTPMVAPFESKDPKSLGPSSHPSLSNQPFSKQQSSSAAVTTNSQSQSQSSAELANDADFHAGFLVRLGVHAQIGRFLLADTAVPERGQRVVCRTRRGVEVGSVLGPVEIRGENADGRILRRMTPEDELLAGQLHALSSQTLSDCQSWLVENRIDAVLMDVEPLLDGKTLYFHFLSDVDERVQTHLDGLVDVYERQVRSSKFAQLLEHGCGPGCGTENAKNGCGSKGGCAVCKIAASCKK